MKRNSILLCFLLGLSSIVDAQQMQLFRTVYYPANPFGGERELKDFVLQEIVYPRMALDSGKEAEVFITFKVNSHGEVIYKSMADNCPEEFKLEAERIFDKIMWEVDPKRSDPDLGFEKLKISFNPKKYLKLVKKRGYDELPGLTELYAQDLKAYDINQVDVRPVFVSEKSMNEFIREEFKYPSIAIQQNISGRVSVEFIIEPYGLASNIRVVEALGGGCNEETIRLVKMMKWEPALKNKTPVRCRSNYQLNFVNPGGSIH